MMKIKFAVWWVLLWYGEFVFGGAFYWRDTSKNLAGPLGYFVARKIADNWEERPSDFFHNVNEQSWRKILKYLTDGKISRIRPEELGSNQIACQVFAEYLPELSNPGALPDIFRLAVCNLLARENGKSEQVTGGGESNNKSPSLKSDRVNQIINRIPASWIKTHGGLLMKALVEFTPPRLKHLNKRALTAILSNLNNSCVSITLDAILTLNRIDLIFISPSCIKTINKLELMELSSIIKNLRNDAFSRYNGPLSEGTIKSLSSEQMKHYAFLVKTQKICNSLDLHYLNPAAVIGVSTDCLYGYLDGEKGRNGLGELWKNIPLDRVKNFSDDMKLSLLNIPLKDFDSMSPQFLDFILSYSKICPTVEISFWSEEKIRYISSECLYKILTETTTRGVPIKLGDLWQKIDPWVIRGFKDDMKSSWLNIDLDDFDKMKLGVLKVIASTPGICSKLGLQFWVEDATKIENIPDQCFYELFISNNKAPIKLGELWKRIAPSSISFLVKRKGFSWDLIHLEDLDLVKNVILSSIDHYYQICSSLSISFWTRENASYITKECLHQILIGGTLFKPITLGELWGYIPCLTASKELQGWLLKEFKNVAGSDFQYMPSSFLELFFSLESLIEFLPLPSTEIILSPKANQVRMNSIQFSELIKLAPNVAGQLLWYSGNLSDDILSNCDGNDIRTLTLVIPGKVDLEWKEFFSQLEEKYYSSGRGEKFFDSMIRSISSKATIHICSTIVDLDEYMSLPWLDRILGATCRSKLSFKVEEVSRITKALKRLTSLWDY